MHPLMRVFGLVHVRQVILGATVLGLILCLLPVSADAQSGNQPVRNSSRWSALRVAVSIPPMQEWVARIAGERAIVTVVLPSGASPHSFEPSPRHLRDLGQADLWFTIGVEFERAIRPKIAAVCPELHIVDVTSRMRFRALTQAESLHEASCVAECDHATVDRDIHTWLGFAQAKAALTLIRDTLSEQDPSSSAAYQKNYDRYVAEIDAVLALLQKELAPLAGSKVFVYHPAFGYFLETFGITQIAVETGGKEPTPRQLAELLERARKEKARAIFVQEQFSQTAARVVAQALHVGVVPIDPLAADWLANLERIGQALRKHSQE